MNRFTPRLSVQRLSEPRISPRGADAAIAAIVLLFLVMALIALTLMLIGGR